MVTFRLIKQKKGWLRLLEVIISILILSSVLLYLYTNNVKNNDDFSNYVSNVQVTILDDIAINPSLRNYTLNNNQTAINEYIEFYLPSSLSFTTAICELNDSVCSPSITITTKKDVFVEERIISANLEIYSPKVVRLFVWQEQR